MAEIFTYLLKSIFISFLPAQQHGLNAKINKLINKQTNRKNNPIEKWAEDVDKHFSKDYIQMAQ